MKYDNFKEHKIRRTKNLSFDKPEKYRNYLSKDFHERCCYCNGSEEVLMVPFHVEHFIPVKAFKGKRDSLNTDYANLMWSCPKCNLSKSDKYKGDLIGNSQIENELFYNPEVTDYNDIFYRNEFGAITSDDPKGKEMITLLKLYHPVHMLSWLIEKLENVHALLKKAIEEETDLQKKAELEKARDRIANIHMEKIKAFRAAYKNKFKDNANR